MRGGIKDLGSFLSWVSVQAYLGTLSCVMSSSIDIEPHPELILRAEMLSATETMPGDGGLLS